MGVAAARREKRKRQKQRQVNVNKTECRGKGVQDTLDVELVVPEEAIPDDPEFRKVYERFAINQVDLFDSDSKAKDQANDEDNLEEEYYSQTGEDDHMEKLSKKKQKLMERIPLADLKRQCKHPEVVEVEDTTAKFPLLLVQLKSARNTIPVPKHWSRKRKYLAGKRGFVKPPFDLPPFIKDTGVCEQRETARAIDDAKSLKAKARDRMHPKLGRLAVNYDRLYDAFFKYQTKPILSGFGQLYFEGKDANQLGSEGRKRGMRPGVMSEALREALGMPANPLFPPPWLFAMQRFGPPPSYPHLRLPGVNAPLPEGAVWGYHPGGWGRAPDGRFDLVEQAQVEVRGLKPMEKVLWGELEPEPENL